MFGDWRPVRGREGGALLPGGFVRPGAGLPQSTLQATVLDRQRLSAEKFFSPAFRVESPGYGIAPPPQAASGNVVGQGMGLDGLGLVNSAWCDSYELAIETLGETLRRVTWSSAAVSQAQKVYDEETSWNLFGRTPVGLWNCEAQTARIAQLIHAVNSELSSRGQAPVPVPPSVQAQLVDAEERTKPPEDMPFWVKAAIIGGIGVTGLIAVAVITGQVAPLFRAAKKVW